MRRRSLGILATLSLVLVLIAGATVVSYWAAPVLADKWVGGTCEAGCEAGRRFVLVQRGHRSAPPHGLSFSATTPGITYAGALGLVDPDGGTFGVGSYTTGTLRVSAAWVPGWVPVAGLAFAPALALRRYRRAVRRAGGFPVTPHGLQS